MKPCSKCGSIDRYEPEPGRSLGRCKLCQSSRNRVYLTINKERVKIRKYSYRNANIEVVSRREANYDSLHREGRRESHRLIREAKKERGECTKCPNPAIKDKTMCARCAIKQAEAIRLQLCKLSTKIAARLRTRLSQAIRGEYKSGSAVKDLGCTIEELKKHLEIWFATGMSWGNWKKDGWHIDHIKPLASFDLTDRTQFLEANHYTNLQPLWAVDNLKKGDK